MKMTLYVSEKAVKYLKQKDNMSRYVSELIISDFERTNEPVNIDSIVSAIVDRLNVKSKYSSNTKELENSIMSILNI